MLFFFSVVMLALGRPVFVLMKMLTSLFIQFVCITGVGPVRNAGVWQEVVNPCLPNWAIEFYSYLILVGCRLGCLECSLFVAKVCYLILFNGATNKFRTVHNSVSGGAFDMIQWASDANFPFCMLGSTHSPCSRPF
jgi:hypothetical protein